MGWNQGKQPTRERTHVENDHVAVLEGPVVGPRGVPVVQDAAVGPRQRGGGEGMGRRAVVVGMGGGFVKFESLR